MNRKRKFFFAALTGVVLGFCIIAGQRLDTIYSLEIMEKSFYIKWLFCAIVLGMSTHLIWEKIFLKKKQNLQNIINKMECAISKVDKKITYPIIVIILLLVWLPVWLSIFPGAFSYDAYDEWMQIYTGKITAHHPVLHVIFMGGLVEGMYQLTGNYNCGIAIYTVIQMVICACTFAYTIEFLRERQVKCIHRMFALLFYSFSPVVQLFVISGTKDVIFTAAFLLFIISLYRIVVEQKEFLGNAKWKRVFCLSAIGTMIMRNNGLYIVLISMIIILFICRRNLAKICMSLLLIGIVYGVYIGPFYHMLSVEPGGIEEMLSVPIQQIARVHRYEKSDISDEDLKYLYTIVPEENWEAYRSTVSDFVKVGFNEAAFNENPKKFLEVWYKIGFRHPLTYVNSFLINTVDFWYPFSVIDGYQDVYGKSSYFDYAVSEPGTEKIIFPKIHSLYEEISHNKESQKIPGMFLLLSPGMYLMYFFMVFLFVWREKRYNVLIVLFPILINFITVLLGPIALVRYVLIQFFVFPLYCVFIKGVNDVAQKVER